MTAANNPMPDIGNLTVESDSITIVDGRIRWMRGDTLMVERSVFGAEYILAKQRDEAYAAMPDLLAHAKNMQEARKVMAQLYQSAEDFMAIYDEGNAPDSEQDKSLRDKMSDAFQWLIEDVQSCVERDKLIRSAAKYGGATVAATAAQPAAASVDLHAAILALEPEEGQTPGFMIGYVCARDAAAALAANKPAAPAAEQVAPEVRVVTLAATYENGPEEMPRVQRLPHAVLNCLIDHSLFRWIGGGLEGEDLDRLYGLMHDTAEEVLARVSLPAASAAQPGAEPVLAGFNREDLACVAEELEAMPKTVNVGDVTGMGEDRHETGPALAARFIRAALAAPDALTTKEG